MIARRTILKATGASLLALPLWARAAPLAVSRTGLVFVAVRAQGRQVRALVDTGSVRGVQLSGTLAAALSLTLSDTGEVTERYQGGGRPVKAAKLAQIEVAGTVFRDVRATIAPGDIEGVAALIGEPFDAVLGWPFLSARRFVLDYRAAALEWRAESSRGGLVLPLEPGLKLPVTKGKLAGKPTTFLVDTGAPWCNVDPSLVPDVAIGDRVELAFEAGGQALRATFRVKDLRAMTVGLGAKAVLGHRFLSAYRLAWAPEAKAIRLAS